VSLLLYANRRGSLFKMYSCNLCAETVKSVKAFVLHCKLHRNEPRCMFKCVAASCKQVCTGYAALKAHFYRHHNGMPTVTLDTSLTRLKCTVSLCERQCEGIKALVVHLKQHIAEGRQVTCPVRGCTCVFRVKSSFTSHMSRKHKNCLENVICETSNEDTQSAVSATTQYSSVPDAEDTVGPNFSDLYLRNVCMFYMKLQGQHLLPASTIQNIVEEIQNIHELGQTYTLNRLNLLLKEMSFANEDIAKICDTVKQLDLFSTCHTGPMRTVYSRAQCFKDLFKYGEPKKVLLGKDEDRTDRFAYYVPVLNTLKGMLESSYWQGLMMANDVSKTDVLCDCNDGKVFMSNTFFQENPSCLKLVLYQDAFEVVNPLGSAKKKHKVLAVYFCLLNMPPHVRSNTDHMQLVLLCREKDFKEFGHSKVFSELLTDLKLLEENGITLADESVVKGALYCIAGDNLGSHCIGGFTENFSTSQYFCRYCLITRSEFQGADPAIVGPERTPETYRSATEQLETEDVAEVRGIKFRSVFNTLQNFNVCSPGMPPCLGHDIFEGVISYDVALYLKYMILKKKWFTYTILNRRIRQFKYKATDACSKPCAVTPKALKLSGQAIQNWNFLRLLPLLIGDKVQDSQDNIWQLTLQLKDIVDLICAQQISKPQVAYLDILIQEYLETRKALFPDNKLRPKHHYLRHYPGLILRFGPLIRLWTMRFESKHSYFKRCARHLKNFKNLCLTLSERHQMFQAFLSAGTVSPPTLQIKDGSPFYSELYSEEVKGAVLHFGFTEKNTMIPVDVQYNGITYKKGQFVVIRNDESLEFGELILSFVKDYSALHFLMRVYRGEFLPHYHMYSVKDETRTLECRPVSKLIDMWPLSSYIKDGYQVVPLKHSVL